MKKALLIFLLMSSQAMAANVWEPGNVIGDLYPCPNALPGQDGARGIGNTIKYNHTPQSLIPAIRAQCGGDYTGFNIQVSCSEMTHPAYVGRINCSVDDGNGFYHIYTSYTSSEPGYPPEPETPGEPGGSTSPIDDLFAAAQPENEAELLLAFFLGAMFLFVMFALIRVVKRSMNNI